MSISYEKKEEIKQAREESNQTPPSLQIIYILHTDWSLPWSWCSKCSSPISFFFLVSPQWRTQIKLNRSKVIDYNGNSSEANVDMLDHTQKSAAATTNEHFVWEKIATDGRRLTFTSSKNKWRCYLSALVGWLTGWGWYTRFSRWKLYSFTYLLLARFPADPLDWKQKLWLGSGQRAKKAFDYKLNLNWTLTLRMRKAATIKFRGHSEQSIWFCWRHSFYSPSNIR